jgi:hypothetical protein
MNQQTWNAPTAPLPTGSRHDVLREMSRRGHSVIGYSVATEMAFGDGDVTAVTVFRDGICDRVATVTTQHGVTILTSRDGEWHDSQGVKLAPADAGVVDDRASWLVGFEA